jgi:hypothetical protein
MQHSRVCGECSACCTTHAVKALKNSFVPCAHTAATGGCEIYPDRPRGCRKYQCAWLQGALELPERPDYLGLVVNSFAHHRVSGESPDQLAISVLEVWEGAAGSETGLAFLARLVSHGFAIEIITFGSIKVGESVNAEPCVDHLLD